ncbi:pentatricopeptide repeat-containing protein At2g17033 [Asparagus officinalis]|uniref:pentatricopeptide repeat-containing protein At2g17033 n=1 Tax=Asparagus officinalis TaxID=4686 RepID=UPI00098DEEC2|nr:pentatricopeptide repeat-containing protein At2g17033 [Asparagus officinalis]
MASIVSYKLLPFPPPLCALRNSKKKSSKPISKHSDRLLSSLSSSCDPSAAAHVIRRFVSSSSKSTALRTLSLLLSLSSPFSLPFYRRISASHWFKWTPKLVAEVIALLESDGHPLEARELVSESVLRLSSQREIAHFYCDLVVAASGRGLKEFVLECCGWIKDTGFVGKRVFECMVRGLSLVGMVEDAEKVLDEMGHLGFKPSGFEYRVVIQGYGRLGSFKEMRRVIGRMENAEIGIDTVCANLVLSCYGDYGNLAEMVTWIRNMRLLGISYSVRTCNSVLNSCPSVVSMVKDLENLPLSMDDLLEMLNDEEALLVKEMAGTSVLLEKLTWSDSEGKLDLHGFHLASAYIILLQWMEEFRRRLRVKEEVPIPLEISVVCGLGKHSIMRGESPVKKLVSKLMSRLKSPMKIDRKNVGRFVAKGKAVKDWLC